ncbi:hypothetical protein CGRA01v4_03256 [Colletotrichum graminicola]|nr:hypothetical protein CGRA01v4_03256 [Colletotrichum graminicola]
MSHFRCRYPLPGSAPLHSPCTFLWPLIPLRRPFFLSPLSLSGLSLIRFPPPLSPLPLSSAPSFLEHAPSISQVKQQEGEWEKKGTILYPI